MNAIINEVHTCRTESNANLITFAETIDFTDLFNRLNAFLKTDCDFYPPEISTDIGRNEVVISITSKRIAVQSDLFSAIFKDCRIEGYVYIYRRQYDDALELTCRGTIQLRCIHERFSQTDKHIRIELCEFRYTRKNKWALDFIKGGKNQND